jgi:hypothetical protein
VRVRLAAAISPLRARSSLAGVLVLVDGGDDCALTSAVTVLLIEVVAGFRAKQSDRGLAVQVLFAALLGLLIIALRLILP